MNYYFTKYHFIKHNYSFCQEKNIVLLVVGTGMRSLGLGGVFEKGNFQDNKELGKWYSRVVNGVYSLLSIGH